MTDRQTDVQPISITCFSIADARKNHKFTLKLSFIFFKNSPGNVKLRHSSDSRLFVAINNFIKVWGLITITETITKIKMPALTTTLLIKRFLISKISNMPHGNRDREIHIVNKDFQNDKRTELMLMMILLGEGVRVVGYRCD